MAAVEDDEKSAVVCHACDKMFVQQCTADLPSSFKIDRDERVVHACAPVAVDVFYLATMARIM